MAPAIRLRHAEYIAEQELDLDGLAVTHRVGPELSSAHQPGYEFRCPSEVHFRVADQVPPGAPATSDFPFSISPSNMPVTVTVHG